MTASRRLSFGMDLLILYLSFGVAWSTSSMCFLVNELTGQPYQNGTLLQLSDSVNWLESAVEWYNPNGILSIHARVKLDFTGTTESYFGLNLHPCSSSSWNVNLAKGSNWGPLVEVLYNQYVGGNQKFNNDADVSFIEDGQFHDLLAVIDRVSTDSLLFNVSIDGTQYISFLFTDGMNGVSDSHVMAVNEFGYSRTIAIDGDAVNAYIESFSVSGQPVSTSRFISCSNTETQSGEQPVNPQSVSPCNPTLAPTVSPIATTDPTARPSLPPTLTPTTNNPTDTPTTTEPTTASPTTEDPTQRPLTPPPTSDPSFTPTIPAGDSTPNPTSSTTVNPTAIASPAPTLKADQDQSTTTSSNGESSVESTHTTTTGAPTKDEGKNSESKSSGSDLFLLMMFIFVAVIICLCILLLLTCVYFKKKQDSIKENLDEVNVPGRQHNSIATENSYQNGDVAKVNEFSDHEESDTNVVEGAISNTLASNSGMMMGHDQTPCRANNTDVQMDEFVVEDEEELNPDAMTPRGPVGATTGGELNVDQNEIQGEFQFND